MPPPVAPPPVLLPYPPAPVPAVGLNIFVGPPALFKKSVKASGSCLNLEPALGGDVIVFYPPILLVPPVIPEFYPEYPLGGLLVSLTGLLSFLEKS